MVMDMSSELIFLLFLLASVRVRVNRNGNGDGNESEKLSLVRLCAVRSYVDIGRLFAKGRQMILVVILCAVPL